MIDANRPDFANTPASMARPQFDYRGRRTETPCVSIVTPFFNAGDVFQETATSVFRQSMQQWEWLIVNDCSDDPLSLAILDKYRATDPRIRIIDRPTRTGPSGARNAGNREARSEYILQLDSDNLVEPTAIEQWCWHLHAEPGCAFVNSWTVGFGARQGISRGGYELGSRFLARNWVDGTALVRRTVIESVGGYDESIHGGLEDWEFWLRCANAGYWGRTLGEALVWYRWRSDHLARWIDWDESTRQERFRSRLRDRYPALWTRSFPAVASAAWSPDVGLDESWPGRNSLTKKKRRLLLVVPWYDVGGADQFNINLLCQLIEHDWEVSVVSTVASEDPWLPRFAAITPDVFALPRFLQPQDYPRFLTYLIHSRSVDTVVLSHSEFGYDVLPYLRQRCPDVSFVDFLHNVEPSWRNGGYPALSLERARHLDVTAVSSESLRAWMLERGKSAERLEVCYVNVDANRVRPDTDTREQVRRARGVPESTPVILFAGRICAQKQPLVVAETLAHLLSQEVRFEAWLVGDGPEMPILRAALKRYKLGTRVRVLGALPHEDVLRHMAAADVFFLPSKYEGIALSIYEAMSAGLPVVSVDVEGQHELVTEECGVLVKRSRPHSEALAYAAVLSDLLGSPGRRAEMGRSGRVRILQEFDVNKMGARMVDVLDHAMRLRQNVSSSELQEAMALALSAAEKARRRHEEQRSAVALEHTLRVRMYATLSRWFSVVHDFAVRKGWNWIPRTGLYARRLFLRSRGGT